MPIQTFYGRYSFAPGETLDKALFSAFKRRSYPANALLSSAYQPLERIFFIEQGILQAYYLDHNSDEITFALAAESELIILPQNLYGFENVPFYYLRALEPVTVFELNNADLKILQQTFHEFALLSLQLAEDSIRQYEERARMLHNPDPAYRYGWFLNRHKLLANRLQVRLIASYLGLSRFTLSRLRSRLSKTSISNG